MKSKTRTYYVISMSFVDGYGCNYDTESLLTAREFVNEYDHEGCAWTISKVTEEEVETHLDLIGTTQNAH